MSDTHTKTNEHKANPHDAHVSHSDHKKDDHEKEYVPWKDVKADLEGRKKDVQNTMALLRGRDAAYLAELTELVRGGKEGTPKFERLEEGHDLYDKELADQAFKLAEKIYSIDYKLDPWYKFFDPDKIKANPHYKRQLESMFNQHKVAIQQYIGQSNFAEKVASVQQNAQQRYMEQQEQLVIGDINGEQHGEEWYEYLLKKHNFDKNRVDKKIFKKNIADIARAEYRGRLDASTLYDIMKSP